MTVDEIFQFSQGVAFPILVAVFFMVKSTKDTEKTNEVLSGLKEALLKLQMTIEQQYKKED